MLFCHCFFAQTVLCYFNHERDSCVCVRRITLCNCLCSSSSSPASSSLFCQPYPRLRNCKSVFLILKMSQYDGSRRWVQLFPRYSCKNWFKIWYLHFYKTYDRNVWRAGTSTGFYSNETNQVGAADVITSRSRGNLKKYYPHYQSAYGHQT